MRAMTKRDAREPLDVVEVLGRPQRQHFLLQSLRELLHLAVEGLLVARVRARLDRLRLGVEVDDLHDVAVLHFRGRDHQAGVEARQEVSARGVVVERHRLRLVGERDEHRLRGVVFAEGQRQHHGRRPRAAEVAREGVGDQVLAGPVEAQLGGLARALLQGVPHELVHHGHVHGFGHDPGHGDVVARMRHDERREDGLAIEGVVLQDELGDDRLHLFGGDHVPAHAADVGLRRLDVALDQRRVLGEDVRLVREDVRRVGDRDLLRRRHRQPVELLPGLVVLRQLDRAVRRAVALGAHARLLGVTGMRCDDLPEDNEVHWCRQARTSRR